jgi:nicotinamidase-related amidase
MAGRVDCGRPALFILAASLLACAGPNPSAADSKADVGVLRLPLRTRVETFKGSGVWDEVNLVKELNPRETAIILCDVWDKHWCDSASQRCDALARKMGPVLAALRARGVTVIHAPSDCMDFYKDAPQRKRMKDVPRVEPPKPLALPAEPPLPIDDSDGGCDDVAPAKQHRAWTRQHPAVPVAEEDFISDNGAEVYSLLKQRGINNLLVMGVHTNMCVLGRSFAIRQMTRWGIRCVLVRDLTDAMYNPKMRPFVSHAEGTELVIQHIEKYWCPTVLSADLVGKK